MKTYDVQLLGLILKYKFVSWPLKLSSKMVGCQKESYAYLAPLSFRWSTPVHFISRRLSLKPKLALTCTGSPVKAAGDPAGSGKQQNALPLKGKTRF